MFRNNVTLQIGYRASHCCAEELLRKRLAEKGEKGLPRMRS
jgi:hypothetical protein